MTKKVLFYINANFTHFAIAYYLQKLCDCKLYAVVDITHKPKFFFETQKLVKFEKIWYYHDHIQNGIKYDELFLKEFEKKFNINLWQMIINERIFYRFFDFHKFTRDEMLSISQQSVVLFKKIFDEIKPDFLASDAPVFFHNELLVQMSEQLGIQNLILSMPKLAGKSMITKQIDQFDENVNLKNIEIKNRTIDELQKYLMKRLPDDAWKNYWNKQSTGMNVGLKSKIEYITSPNQHEKTHYTYFGRTKLNVIISTLKNTLKKKSRQKFIKNNLKNKVDLTVPYVYFPLSVDMERNLLIDSAMYTNQIEIIRIIAKSLPINYRLYVKENPAQASREWRSKKEYKEIQNIPNVTLIQPTVLGRELIENSSLVISIAGTSSLEATFHQKPSIIFGKVIYNMLPSVFQVNDIKDLPQIIDTALKTSVNISDLDKFVILYEKNTVQFDLIEFETRFNQKFYYGGTLFDVNIDANVLKDFLDAHQNYFSELMNEYIKKINLQ